MTTHVYSDEKKEDRFKDREIQEVIKRMPEKLRLLMDKTNSFLITLGNDVSLYEAQRYYSYKISGKSFAVVIPDRTRVIINLLVNPETVEIDNYFTRDLKNLSSYGSKKLRLQLFVRDDDQFELAKTYMVQAYKECKLMAAISTIEKQKPVECGIEREPDASAYPDCGDPVVEHNKASSEYLTRNTLKDNQILDSNDVKSATEISDECVAEINSKRDSSAIETCTSDRSTEDSIKRIGFIIGALFIVIMTIAIYFGTTKMRVYSSAQKTKGEW